MNDLVIKSTTNTFSKPLTWFTFAFCEEGSHQDNRFSLGAHIFELFSLAFGNALCLNSMSSPSGG